jgi:hypothetical protein
MILKAWKHFKTITRHRWLVRRGCFMVGLYWQGLTHDLSKYTPTEFRVGVKYFQGNRSPNGAERDEKGYSLAWMHHKGRNRHHYGYWTDLHPVTRRYDSVPMPRKYLAEMVMDRIAACKVYRGKAYDDGAALDYLQNSIERELLHDKTRRELVYLLTMLKEKGEKETFHYIKQNVLKDKPFPWEEMED